jgi:hypothetical protein
MAKKKVSKRIPRIMSDNLQYNVNSGPLFERVIIGPVVRKVDAIQSAIRKERGL